MILETVPGIFHGCHRTQLKFTFCEVADKDKNLLLMIKKILYFIPNNLKKLNPSIILEHTCTLCLRQLTILLYLHIILETLPQALVSYMGHPY